MTDPVITITEPALEKILQLRANEADGASLGLRIEVTGVNGLEYAYDLAFEPVAHAVESDVVHRHGDLPVVVPAADLTKLQGATLDVPSDSMQGGLVLRNPNSPSPMAGATDEADLELEGEPADRVQQLLDQMINPAIASHGGFAELVAIEEDTAYLRMGGGCQGCGMAKVTLSQGIEQAILTHVPEVARVVDVTDHASGANPYFESAKK